VADDFLKHHFCFIFNYSSGCAVYDLLGKDKDDIIKVLLSLYANIKVIEIDE
jgi:hypothetical protein